MALHLRDDPPALERLAEAPRRPAAVTVAADRKRAAEIARKTQGQGSAYLSTLTLINATPGAVAVLTFPGLGRALLVPLIYFPLHNLETNIITPPILSRRLTLNPLVIFLWLSLWFWLWGIPGALLAVPMLKTLEIFCDNIPQLAPVGELLGR
jgi:hypothetical protein